jgi:putative NADH-flavin reductase
MATILIIGASKGIGLEAVKAGLAAGHTVRALARSAARIAIEHANLTKVAGDARRQADVARAAQGCDAVIQAIGVGSLNELAFGTTLFSDSTRVTIDAMKTAAVRRLIAVTGAGAGNSRGRNGLLYDHLMFPLLLQRIYADKDRSEAMITASGLDWTIVRPGLLTNGPRTSRYRALANPNDWRTGSISRADVADFLIAQVAARDMIGQTPLLIA